MPHCTCFTHVREQGTGGGKTGSICHLRFPFIFSIGGFQVTHTLGKIARKMSLPQPFLCVNASKNQDVRVVSPYASTQSTGKTTSSGEALPPSSAVAPMRGLFTTLLEGLCVVYLEMVDCAQWRSRTNELARQMDASLKTQSLFCTLTLEPNRQSHQSHALDPLIKRA